MKIRIGLSMRVVEASGYIEPRDALAHDWMNFLRAVLPEVRWIFLPNLGRKSDVIAYAEYWRLNAFILTGGNSLFEAPLRDETEMNLLAYAEQRGIPVLGVCRGMQLICHSFGMPVSACPDPSEHVATTHDVYLRRCPVSWKEPVIRVNSYHEQCVGLEDAFEDSPLTPFAVTGNGLVEGVVHEGGKILGIMWHPERNSPSREFDKHLIDHYFSLKE